MFVFFAYTFLREAGHALAGLAFGQTLTAFNVNFWNFDAHVGLAGSLTQSQRALQSIAGAGLPLLVWFLFIATAPTRMAGCGRKTCRRANTGWYSPRTKTPARQIFTCKPRE